MNAFIYSANEIKKSAYLTVKRDMCCLGYYKNENLLKHVGRPSKVSRAVFCFSIDVDEQLV